MEYLQYATREKHGIVQFGTGFKPYYKWNTFNTNSKEIEKLQAQSFKPYYKWNTFNTKNNKRPDVEVSIVLNLIINGIPSIL